jgi:CheY-like chemotaxis protein
MDLEHIGILVVDDLWDMAESTADLLSLWGYDATPCDSGAAALACARVRRPAGVLLDLVMPRMNGFEFARAFRALEGCGGVPLVALSGYSSATFPARAREAGIGHLLLKPVAPVCLRALLLALIPSTVVTPGLRAGAAAGPLRVRRARGVRAPLMPA